MEEISSSMDLRMSDTRRETRDERGVREGERERERQRVRVLVRERENFEPLTLCPHTIFFYQNISNLPFGSGNWECEQLYNCVFIYLTFTYDYLNRVHFYSLFCKLCRSPLSPPLAPRPLFPPLRFRGVLRTW